MLYSNLSVKPNYEIFVINLDQSKHRLSIINKLMIDNGVEFIRIPGVNGQDLKDEDIKAFYSFDDKNSHYKELNKGELGCYLSHRKVWQEIIKRNLDFALVFEDDLHDLNRLNNCLSAIQKLKPNWDYIKLAQHKKRRKFVAELNLGDYSVGVYNKIPAGTYAQAVSLNGAKKLLKNSARLYRPIDLAIQRWWEKEISVFGMTPCLVTVPSLSESEIDSQSQRQNAKVNRFKQFKQDVLFKVLNAKNRKFLIKKLKSLV